MEERVIIDKARIDSSENLVCAFLKRTVESSADLKRGQAFGGEFLHVLAQSIIVPALVAVGAEMAKDGAKEAYHAGRAKLSELFSSNFSEKTPTAMELGEIRGHLMALGLTEAQTQEMLDQLSKHLSGEETSYDSA
jgi:hypothetical protein